jgi:hypothetical protein
MGQDGVMTNASKVIKGVDGNKIPGLEARVDNRMYVERKFD